MLNIVRTLENLIPDGEELENIRPIKCRFDGRVSAVVPTRKRLMSCQRRFFGLIKEISDDTWGKFEHVRISQRFGTYTLELKFVGSARTLRIERLRKEDFDVLYRCIRERITANLEKNKLLSRVCPSCKEIISYRATKCPRCHLDFAGSIPAPD